MIFHINFEYAILGHKIFHRVLREELLELPVQLSGEGLIVRYDQSRLVQGGDHVGHGEGLAGTCYPKQSLELVAFLMMPCYIFLKQFD